MRTILTVARRTDHVEAVKAARAAGVKTDIQTELKGLLQHRDYLPVVIAAESMVLNGTVDPSIEVALTGDTFEPGITLADLEVDPGTTALTLSSVTRDNDSKITVGFTGTAVQGTLTLKVKASGLVRTPYLISNEIKVVVPEP